MQRYKTDQAAAHAIKWSLPKGLKVTASPSNVRQAQTNISLFQMRLMAKPRRQSPQVQYCV